MPSADPADPHAGWIGVDVPGAFYLGLPPQYRGGHAVEIDSDVGRYESPGSTLTFMSGLEGGATCRDFGPKPTRERSMQIDGTPVDLRYYDTARSRCLLVEYARKGLTVLGIRFVYTPEKADEVEAIVRTLQVVGQAIGAGPRSP